MGLVRFKNEYFSYLYVGSLRAQKRCCSLPGRSLEHVVVHLHLPGKFHEYFLLLSKYILWITSFPWLKILKERTHESKKKTLKEREKKVANNAENKYIHYFLNILEVQKLYSSFDTNFQCHFFNCIQEKTSLFSSFTFILFTNIFQTSLYRWHPWHIVLHLQLRCSQNDVHSPNLELIKRI